MPALIGHYEYVLDSKHRLFVPPRYREELTAEKGRHFILSLGLDPCLYLFLPSQWERLLTESKEIFQLKNARKQRAAKRMLFSNAMEAPLDDQGRILLPQHLKDYAALKKEVVVVGTGNKAELWNKSAFAVHTKSAQQLFRQLGASLDL